MKGLLGFGALFLVAVLVLQWHAWPPDARLPAGIAGPADAALPTAPAADPNPLDMLDSPLEKEEYAIVAERPLFMPERRPAPEEPDKPAPPEEKRNVEIDAMDLTAIVITPMESVAWVRTPSSQKPEKLRQGDDLDGWTVKTIFGDEIELERQGETDTLVLRDYKKAPPPAARRPRRPVSRTQRPTRPTPVKRTNTPPRPGARLPRTRSNAQPTQP